MRFTGTGFNQAIDYFRQAIRIDPGYALAYVGIGLAYADLAESGLDDPRDAFLHAKDAVAKALAADSELAEAHATLAYIRFTAEYDWEGAEEEFRYALELNPGAADTYDYYGRLLAAVGRFDEAVEMLKRARELDPMAHRIDLATALIRAGRYDEAIDAANDAMILDPNYGRAHATIGWAYFLKGMTQEGLAELEKAVALSPAEAGWLAQLGEAYGLAGRTGDARSVLHRLQKVAEERYVSPYHFAYVHTGLGEHDTAIDWLERAYEQRSGAIYGLKGSFLFTPLRSHPRFIALLQRMRLA
jgi:serine/threonine-protein kinase